MTTRTGVILFGLWLLIFAGAWTYWKEASTHDDWTLDDPVRIITDVAPQENRMTAISLRMVFQRVLINLPVARFLLGLGIVLSVASPTRGEKDLARESFLQQYQPHAKAIESFYTNVYVKWRQSTEMGQGKLSIGCIDGKYNRLNYRWNIGRNATVDSRAYAQ